MASLEPDETVGAPVLRMGWSRQAFVHWPFDPAAVQRLLPSGLVAEEYQGRAWVSLTPFVMADVRPAVLPALQMTNRLSTFPETNLRTYVRGPGGRDGLWFLSVEAASAAMSLITRAATGAPYHLGDLSVTEHGGVLAYAGCRRGGEPAYRLRIRPGTPLVPSALEVCLTSHWRVYTRQWGMLLETPVWHEPWPLHTAAIEELGQTLTPAAGLADPRAEPIAHYSPGVHQVRVGIPRPAICRRPTGSLVAGEGQRSARQRFDA
ncbi:YqjF family protein [Streptomyces sp. NPDC018833]|uniref:YqjF family protein n=1 Tax=Streptomyces sp. NPDC018833 TaxID=3365053 RepID=UPI0037A799B4